MTEVRDTRVKTLREWRLERGLTLEQLAEAVGLTKGSVGDYEKGRREPGMNMAYKLAYALSIELSQVADWIPEWYSEALERDRTAQRLR